LALTPLQRKVIVALYEWHDKAGFDLHVRFDHLVVESPLPRKLKPEKADDALTRQRKERVVASQLLFLRQAGLIEWNFVASATPWWFSSIGKIGHQGVSVAYESKPTVRFVKLAIAAVFSLTASVVGALLVALLTPSNLQQLAAGLFGGTVGGSLFGTLSR